MAPPPDEHADRGRALRIEAAFREGDLTALRRALDAPDGFPNVVAHPGMGRCLTYAIFHSPLGLVRQLLDAGADPNADDGDGFPPLMAALASGAAVPGATPQGDVHARLSLLLDHGARPNQRGVNDYTPLHAAAAQGDLRAVEMLLAHGADPNAITRIDDRQTPLDVARAAGHDDVAERLRHPTPG